MTMGLACDRDGYDLRTPRCVGCGSRGCSKGCAVLLDLASRNDGYLVEACGNDALTALRTAGLVYTRPSGADGYVIARAVQAPLRRNVGHGSRYAGRVEAEAVAAS